MVSRIHFIDGDKVALMIKKNLFLPSASDFNAERDESVNIDARCSFLKKASLNSTSLAEGTETPFLTRPFAAVVSSHSSSF